MTLSINGGIYATSVKSGNDIVVSVGEGKITLSGAAKLSTVNIVETPVNINNADKNATIYGTNANDTIINTGENAAIFALEGKDSLDNNNQGVNSTIDAGSGDDKISNTSKKSTLAGQSGNDTILNQSGTAASILGGDGNDLIGIKGALQNTILAGIGDDTITVDWSSNNALIIYRAGDGDDYIEGFNESSSLSIAGGVYSTTENNHDVIVTVNENKITLAGAASVSPLNIIGVEDVHLKTENRDDNVSIYGTMFEDSVGNIGTNVTILTQDGNDSIHNGYWNDRCSNVTIDAGRGDDTIINEGGSTVSVIAGEGNDVIYGFKYNSTLLVEGDYSTTKSGRDIIVTVGDGKITLKNGADLKQVNIVNTPPISIDNKNDNVLLVGTNASDTIQNSGKNVTIQALGGNDSIHNNGANASINGNEGNDNIGNNGSSVTIDGGTGNDRIENAGNDAVRSSLSGGSGNDYLSNWMPNNVTLNGGDGDDTLYNYGDDIKIIGGAGDDSIFLRSGSDDVLIIYNADDGNDIINGFRADSTLQIDGGSGAYSTQKSGNDTIINIKSGTNTFINGNAGNDSIRNIAPTVTVDGGAGDDSIQNYYGVDFVTINAGTGADVLSNSGSKVLINTSADNDLVYYNSGSNVTIDGDEGNDRLFNSGNNNSINGGEGSDYIENQSDGNSVTMSGGKGDDTIVNYYDLKEGKPYPNDAKYGLNALFVYNAGDGNDSIVGFKNNSTLSISGSAYSTTKSGSDIIVTVGDGNITLKGAATLSTVNITGEIVNAINVTVGDGNITLKGAATLSKVNISGVEYKPLNTVNYDDNVSIVGSQFKDTIENYGSNVTILANEDNDTIMNKALDTSILGGAGDDTIANIGAKATILAEEGDDSINNYGKFSELDAGAGDDIIENSQWGNNALISGGAGKDTVKNWAVNTTISGGKGDDYIINYSVGVLFNYTALGGNDLIEGFNATSTLAISGGTYKLDRIDSDLIVTIGDENITLKGAATLSAPNIIGEQDKSAHNIENDKDGVVIRGTGENDTIDNSGDNVTILALGGDDSIYNGGGGTSVIIDAGAGNDTIDNQHVTETTIDAGAGDDYIFNNANNVTINGEAGNDTVYIDFALFNSINAGAGNDSIYVDASADTINAGEGDDTITLDYADTMLMLYTPGDGFDLIQGFKEDSTLSIASNKFSTIINGDDVIVTVGKGNITLEGAATVEELNIAGIKDGGSYVAFTDRDNIKIPLNENAVMINGSKILGSNSAQIDNAKTITLPDGALVYNPVTVNADNRNVTLSGGAAIVEDTSAKVNITASKGNNTIVSQGENVSVSLRGGKTDIFALEGRMTVTGYNPATGSGFHTDYEDIFEAVDNGSIYFDKGKLTIGEAVIIDEGGNKLVNLFNADGELQKVGEALDDTALNLSKETEDLVLSADEYSTLTSGAGNDSIFAFAGSQVDAGAGKNYIELEEHNDGITIILSSGKTTVKNFSAGFNDGDKISVDAKNNDFNFDGENLKITSSTSRATLQNISSDGSAARILTLINGKETKAAIAQAGEVISAGDDLADAYYGKKSGVDFSAYDDSLTIDLSKNFYGINQVTVGGGLNTLISSSANETLTGSDGTTEYVFDKNCGRDQIQNFNFDEDKINVGTNAVTAVRVNSAGGVRMEIGYVGSVTLADAQGKNFKINNSTAIVDKNLTYNDAANYFVATAQNASLTVTESAEIWLDGSHGKTFDGDIKTLDATNSDGKTSLAGNDLDNTILAGNGDASLWGGNGGDDLLVGGAGKNTFFYLQGNGSDTISGAHDGDEIILSTVTLEQISSTSITGDAVSINFKDGGSLQINSNADITYQLADGSKFFANHEQAVWLTK